MNTIQTRYAVLDQVWYLNPGTRKAEERTVNYITTKSKDYSTDEELDVRTVVRYNIDSHLNMTVEECELFATKEELLASL